MKIKYCGLTRVEDYICAWELGVDYVGFVCYEKSPRYIRPEKIAEILTTARSMKKEFMHRIQEPKTVGLFVDWSEDQVLHAINIVGFDIAQIYNEDMADYLPIPYWKVWHVKESHDIKNLNIMKDRYAQEGQLDALILDTKTSATDTDDPVLGGTGQRFNWDYLSEISVDIPYFVAGGINEHNIVELIKKNPYGIDISSGLEVNKGIKDHTLMRKIIALMRDNMHRSSHEN